MKHVYFFADEDDLRSIFSIVESKGNLKYTLTGNFTLDSLPNGIAVISSGLELPKLGTASAESSSSCNSYLVSEPATEFNLRCLRGVDGRERILVDQLVNPDTVVFTTAGRWKENVLLNSRVATVSDSKCAQALMRRFSTAIKKCCSKVRAFYVAPRAMAHWESGMRLAGAAQSPPEFDLMR